MHLKKIRKQSFISQKMEPESVKLNILNPRLNNFNSTEEDLNSYIESNGKKWDDPELEITYNFKFEGNQNQKLGFLRLNSNSGITNEKEDENSELSVTEIADLHHKLLRNPLLELYLQCKWQLMRNIFLINIICYGLFLVMLTTMSILLVEIDKCTNETDFSSKFHSFLCTAV